METTKAQSRLLALKQKLKDKGQEVPEESSKNSLIKNKLKKLTSASLKETVKSKRPKKDEGKIENPINKKSEDKTRSSSSYVMERLKRFSKNKSKKESPVDNASRKQRTINKDNTPVKMGATLVDSNSNSIVGSKTNKKQVINSDNKNQTSTIFAKSDCLSKLIKGKKECLLNKKNSVSEVQTRNMFRRKLSESNKLVKQLNNHFIESKKGSCADPLENDEDAIVSPRKRRLKDRGPLFGTYSHESMQDDLTHDQDKPRKMPLNNKCKTSLLDRISKDAKPNKSVIEKTNESREEIFDDSMEWEPYKVDILRNVRTETCDDEEMMDWQEILDVSLNTCVNENSPEERTVYFVVDTNVMIQSIFLVKQLITLPDLRGFKAVLMVPWQVLKELDKLKNNSDNSVAFCARKAARFLSENLSNQNKVIFQRQSLHLEDSLHVLVEVPDDHIIKCCCQIKDMNKNVILLSNDINLCVKSSAIGDIPAVSDKWLSQLLEEDASNKSSRLHSFEIEPKEKMISSESSISWFMYTLTHHLSDFLSNVIKNYYKRKYNSLWPLWTTEKKLSLLEIFPKIEQLNLSEACKSDFTDKIWSFFKKKNSYGDLNARDVEDFGRNCILFSQSISLFDSETCKQFDQKMGFLKTGNIYENIYGYTFASSTVAQSFFKKMEDNIKNYLAYLEDLVMKINMKNVIIPDTSVITRKIDKYLLVANEASTIFLLLNNDEEIPPSCPEVVIFHKVLLDFLEIVQENNILPVFSPEDISNFVNQKRDELNPAAIEWLSDVRRRFMECKVFFKRH